MRFVRSRSISAAAVLLVALALSSVLADGHGHDPLTGVGGHEEHLSFQAGHSQPDNTVHVEGATLVASSPCVACLLRPRERVVPSLPQTPGKLTPHRVVRAPDSERDLPAGAHRLPATRAPPQV